MKKITVSKLDIGKFVRVLFLDTGATDGIITQVDGPNEFRFLPLSHMKQGDISNNAAQIISLGKYITAEHSGL